MTWNQETERLDAAVDLEDAPLSELVAVLVEARKRAHDADRECEAHKTAALRLREDLVERTSERDAAREEVKTLHHNLMAITAQEQERADQLAMAEAACRRDATALGAVQAELAVLKAAHVWIKPSDRLPAKNQTVVAMFRTRNKPSPKILLFAPMFKDYPYMWHSLETHDRFNSTYIIGWAPIPSEAE